MNFIGRVKLGDVETLIRKAEDADVDLLREPEDIWREAQREARKTHSRAPLVNVALGGKCVIADIVIDKREEVC